LGFSPCSRANRCNLQVFIISGLGTIWVWFYIPETKGVPLEETAALFGDRDEVMIFSEDIHVDHRTHKLVIDTHGGAAAGSGFAHRVATKASVPEKVQENMMEKV
jgi:hypothetical protein